MTDAPLPAQTPAPAAPPAAPAAPAATPAAAPPPMRPASAPPPVRPAPAAAPSHPAPPPAAKPGEPTADWSRSPQERFAAKERELAASDPWRSGPDTVLSRDSQGRLLVNGKLAGDVDPGSAPTGTPEPAPDEPRYKFGDGDDAPELTAKQIAETRAHMAAEQSRKAQIPADASQYRATLPESWTPPAQFKDYKVDDSHPIYGQAREFAFRHGLDQAAFSEMLALSASREIGTAQTLQRARDAEIAKLGSAGTSRVSAVENFLISKVGAETYKRVAPLLATEAQVRVYEAWMRESLSGGAGSYSANRSGERRETVDEKTWNSWSYSQQVEYARRHSSGGR
jgi:hypothetical protein